MLGTKIQSQPSLNFGQLMGMHPVRRATGQTTRPEPRTRATRAPKGIAALAAFIQDSGAFTFTGEKYTPKDLPSFHDEPEPPDIDSEDDESDAEP